MNDAINAESSWVDLVDVCSADRVLLLHTRVRCPDDAFRQRGAAVTSVLVDATTPVVIEPESWDLVCFDGVPYDEVPDRLWRQQLAPHGRVVVVGDHLASPLRVLDGLLRRSAGPGATWGHRRTARRLAATGLVTQQAFGLLRSSSSSVVAFDARTESGMRAVFGSTLAHVHGWRATAIAVAARMPARLLLRLCPGWLVVAGDPGPPPEDRVVGKVSNRDSEEIKLLRGDPVTVVERRHLNDHPSGEVAALRELEEAGFTLAPRVLGEPGPQGVRYSWMSGSSLAIDRLDDAGLVRWVARAAEVLAELQALSRRSDGTVLVHGDFWLGNLLTDGDRVVAVVDWTEAHRGSPDVDRLFLVTSLDHWIGSDSLRERLEQARDAALPTLST